MPTPAPIGLHVSAHPDGGGVLAAREALCLHAKLLGETQRRVGVGSIAGLSVLLQRLTVVDDTLIFWCEAQ